MRRLLFNIYMGQKTDKIIKAKALKAEVDEIALRHGFYKDKYNPVTLSSNYRDPVLPIVFSFYPTTCTLGISYDKGSFKWFKNYSLENIKKIFESPLNYI